MESLSPDPHANKPTQNRADRAFVPYGGRMPYPSHYLLQFGGPKGTPALEIWSCGIRMIPVGGDLEPGETLDYLEDVCSVALKDWFVRTTSQISTEAKLAFCKLNRIAPDGTYAEPLTVQHFYPSAWSGGVAGAGTAAVVPQASLCLTWHTDTVSRGLASRGRIYSPSPAVSPNIGTGLFPIGNATTIATSAAQLISDLRGSGEAGSMTPNIVSDNGGGVAHRIDQVSVDNRVDIVRKRANQIIPARSKVVVPA